MKKEYFYRDNYSITEANSFEPRLQEVIRIFRKYLSENQTVLDIGCGDGNFAIFLKNVLKAKDIFGIDISEKAVSLCIKNGINAVKLNVDDDKLPYENGFFDAIFCGEVIEHLYDPDFLLSEIYRVLKKGGIFLITTPNLAAWHNRAILCLGFQPHFTEVSLKYHYVGKLHPKAKDLKASGHIRVFTYRALKDLLKIHGFTLIKTTGIPGVMPVPLNVADAIFKFVPSLSSDLLLVVVK